MKILNKKEREKSKIPQKGDHLPTDNTELTTGQIKKDIDNHIKQINQSKSDIGRLTKFITEELLKIRELRQQIEAYEEINEKKKSSLKEGPRVHSANEEKVRKRKKGQKQITVDLDYELANMNMIKKLLNFSTQLEQKKDDFKSKISPKKGLLHRRRIKKLGLDGEIKNGQKKILIVEDDPTTINIISYVLSQNNYSVSSSLNAEDGLKMTLKDKPDLIILDIMLPGMDGFQLLSILKENEETDHIPVVLISSLTGEKDILKGLEIGAVDYILKPFSPQILLLKVKKLMSTKNGNISPHYRL